ncbi:MAG: hypothetical protein IKE28_06030 [Solobacterium sp.]|nr:hypothetical protein [Solobacterium sp.]
MSSNKSKTKEIEIFNDVFKVPDSAFIIPTEERPDKDNYNENVEYLVFEDDVNDSEEKWRNQVIFYTTEWNSTPDITYDMAKVVLEDYVNAWESTNSSLLKGKKKEYYELSQTPAYKISNEWEDGGGTNIFWFYMNNYHDIVQVRFVHNNKAKHDYSDDYNNMIQNMFIKGLDGDLAFKDTFGQETSKPSSSESTGTKACDGEPYGAGSDWAKYDKNKDGCINDSEFQAGMGDAIDERLNGTSSRTSTSDRTGLCEFKSNGKYVCNKKAMSGYSFCKEHWDMLYDTYKSLTD